MYLDSGPSQRPGFSPDTVFLFTAASVTSLPALPPAWLPGWERRITYEFPAFLLSFLLCNWPARSTTLLKHLLQARHLRGHQVVTRRWERQGRREMPEHLQVESPGKPRSRPVGGCTHRVEFPGTRGRLSGCPETTTRSVQKNVAHCPRAHGTPSAPPWLTSLGPGQSAGHRSWARQEAAALLSSFPKRHVFQEVFGEAPRWHGTATKAPACQAAPPPPSHEPTVPDLGCCCRK